MKRNYQPKKRKTVSFSDDIPWQLEAATCECRRWIETVTRKSFQYRDFKTSLQDGKLLCNLVECLGNLTIGSLNNQPTQLSYEENLKLFLLACCILGLDKDSQLCDSSDLSDQPQENRKTPFYLLVRFVYQDTFCCFYFCRSNRQVENYRKIRNIVVNLYWLGIAAWHSPTYQGPGLNLAVFSSLFYNSYEQGMMSKPVVRKTVEFHLTPRTRGISLQHESFYRTEGAETHEIKNHVQENNIHASDREQNETRGNIEELISSSRIVPFPAEDDCHRLVEPHYLVFDEETSIFESEQLSQKEIIYALRHQHKFKDNLAKFESIFKEQELKKEPSPRYDQTTRSQFTVTSSQNPTHATLSPQHERATFSPQHERASYVATSSGFEDGFVRQESRNIEKKSINKRDDTPRRYSHQPQSSYSSKNNGFIVGSLTRRTPHRRPESADNHKVEHTKPRRPESADNYRRAETEHRLPQHVHGKENMKGFVDSGGEQYTADDVKTPRTQTREEAQLYARTPIVDSPSDEWYVSGSRAQHESAPKRTRSRSAVGILDFSGSPITELLSHGQRQSSHEAQTSSSVQDPAMDMNFRFTESEERKPSKSTVRKQRISLPAVHLGQQQYRVQSTEPSQYSAHVLQSRDHELFHKLDNEPVNSITDDPNTTKDNSGPGDYSSLRRRKIAVASVPGEVAPVAGNAPVKAKKKVSFSDDDFSPRSSPSQQRNERTMSFGDDDMDLRVDLSALTASKSNRRGRTRRKYSFTVGLFGQRGDRDSSVESARESLDSHDQQAIDNFIHQSNISASLDQSEPTKKEQIIPRDTTHVVSQSYRPSPDYIDQSEPLDRTQQISHDTPYLSNESNRTSRDYISAHVTSTDSDSAYGGSPTLQQNFHLSDRPARKTRTYSLQPQNYYSTDSHENEVKKDYNENTNIERNSVPESNTRRVRSRSFQYIQPEKRTRRRSALEILQPKGSMQLDPLLPDSDDVFTRDDVPNQDAQRTELVNTNIETNFTQTRNNSQDNNTNRRKSSHLGFSKVTQLEISSAETNRTQLVENRGDRPRSESRPKVVQFADEQRIDVDGVEKTQRVDNEKMFDQSHYDNNDDENRSSSVEEVPRSGGTNVGYLKELEKRREMLEKEQQRMQEEIEKLRQEQKKIIQSEAEQNAAGSGSSVSSEEVAEPPLTDSKRIDPQTLLKLVAAEERFWKTNMERQRSVESVGSSNELTPAEEKYWEHKLRKIRKEKSHGSLDELAPNSVTVRKDKRRMSETPQPTMNSEWYKTLPRKSSRNRRISQPVGRKEQANFQDLRAEEEFMAQEAERFMREKLKEQSKKHLEPNVIISNKPLTQDDKQKSLSQPTWLEEPRTNPVQRNWSLRENSTEQTKIPNGGLNIPRSNEGNPQRDDVYRCSSCTKPVDRDICMYVAALDRYWHTVCFRCTVCNTQLSNGKSETQIRLFKSRPLCSSCDVSQDATGSFLCSQI